MIISASPEPPDRRETILMIINDICREDLSRLSELYELLSGRRIDHGKMKEAFERIRDDDDYYLFGARSDDDYLVGTVMAVVCHDLATDGRPFIVMENLIVDPGWHRKGVGSLLVRAVESVARTRNCIYLQFCSSSFRTGAHAFYEEAGYSPEEVKGFRKFFHKIGDPENDAI